MTRRDPHLAAAQRLARLLGCAADPAADHDSSAGLTDLLDQLATLQRLRRCLRLCHERGWSLAAGRLWPQVLGQVREAHAAAGRLLSDRERPRPQPPSLRCLIEDLRQLAEEFEDVEFDLKAGRIVAGIGPVELEGIRLGPFAIELHLARLSSRQDASCFDCVALKPNPASSNESVTHPHVSDRQLCAGEAAAPISAALRQGRVCDAFCLVRSVLQTYNPASPYVALDEWDGVTCDDCGHTSSRDGTSWCEHCDHDCCDDCMSCCDACDGSCCRGCLTRDEQADRDLCPSCRRECGDCGRVVDRGDVELGLCPQCRQEQEEPDQEDDSEQEEQHDAQSQSTRPGEPGPAAPIGHSPGAAA